MYPPMPMVFLAGAQTLKACFLLVFLLLGVSPILKTLTDTVSTDSIYAMAAGMLGVNLFTHDYTTGLGHHLYVCASCRLTGHGFHTCLSLQFGRDERGHLCSSVPGVAIAHVPPRVCLAAIGIGGVHCPPVRCPVLSSVYLRY